MRRESIEYVLLKKNGKTIRLDLDEMTKPFYHQNEEYIFCPNDECTANIEYCEGGKLKYFRTLRTKLKGEIVEERHLPDCPFGLMHELKNKPKSIFDPSISYPISDDHIMRSLKRAFQNHKKEVSGQPIKPRKKTKRETYDITKKESSDFLRGKGKITFNEDDEVDTKMTQPFLYQRYVDDLTDADLGNSRMIKGNIKELIYKDNFIAINLESKDDKKVRVYFSEEYRANNPQQYNQIREYERYFKGQTENKEKVFFVCAGDVVKDDFGVSIYAKSYKHILIDGMSHYDIMKRFW